MAIISLFSSTNAKIDQLELDASLSESHEASATLTKNPIENGSPVSDHVNLEPLRLTIEGVVTTTPLGASGIIGSAANAAVGQIGLAGALGGAARIGAASVGGLVATAIGGGSKSRQPSDVYTYLFDLWKARSPIEIVTALKVYKSMIVTNLSVPRSIANTNMLRFSVTLEQVVIAYSAYIYVVPGSGPVADALTPKSDLGKQGGSGLTGKADENTTFAYGTFYGGGG